MNWSKSAKGGRSSCLHDSSNYNNCAGFLLNACQWSACDYWQEHFHNHSFEEIIQDGQHADSLDELMARSKKFFCLSMVLSVRSLHAFFAFMEFCLTVWRHVGQVTGKLHSWVWQWSVQLLSLPLNRNILGSAPCPQWPRGSKQI